MSRKTICYAFLLLLGVFIGSISQVLLKKSAKKKYKNKINEYFNPLVIIAYCLFVITTILSIISYRIIPLSMGPILESTSYIYVTIFGVLIFNEKINKKKLIALTIMIFGVFMYAFCEL